MRVTKHHGWIAGALAGISLLAGGAANAGPVVYEITDYAGGNFSASWLHGADGCHGTGPNTGLTLYMCGSPKKSINGRIEGNYQSGILEITGGVLNIGGTPFAVGPGVLGPFGGSSVWGFHIAGHGFFGFESLGMGSGQPNIFDGNELILWGQNTAAYICAPGQPHCAFGERWGIDLYGKRIAVPEPATLALLGLGLLSIAAMRRRRQPARIGNA